jgi:hypothetical protein
MGTRALDLDRWFLIDDEWDGQRAVAAGLVASERREVVVGTDGPAVAGPAGELLATVRTRLSETGSGGVAPLSETGSGGVAPLSETGSGGVAPLSETGSGGVAPDEHPLVAARLLVADDLCLLLPDGPRWLLAAGCVCFPSYWRPRDKVGRPLAAVHDPVPGYPGPLAERVDSFLGRLAPGRGVWRRNWLIHDVPDLHLPGPHATEPLPASRSGATEPLPASRSGATEALPVRGSGRWLRSERQALVRLVDHDAVVFSIRTQQVPLGVLGERPDVARALAEALRGWSPELRAYKGGAVDDAVLRWLDAQS